LSGLPPQTNPEFGWTVGAGLEWAFAENWTAKVEYLFVDLAQNAACNHGYSCGFNSNSNVKLNESIVRVGVNFKYGH
jgi:outer membrane immunogenic protein